MGQVYYWLGKNAEGKQLFDELLAGRQRDFETLYAVAGALRNLGAATESRVLLEEAYEKGAEGAEKHRAAALRAITSTDVDDAVVWLRRADPKELQVQASLSDNLGQTALRRGADDEAAAHFRQAIAAYDKMPEHASKLNNGALSRFQLFAATGDRQAFAEAAAMLEKAAALSPGDSIVLFNSGTSLAEAAALDLLGDALDFKALKRRPTLDLLLFLCRDEGELSRQAERVRSHPGFAKAAAQLQRALVLAPRGVSGYAIASWMLFFGRDARGLKDLDERLGGLDLDLEESKKEALDGYLGRDDAKLEARFEAAIARHQRQIAEAGRPRDLAFAVNATGLADSSQSLSMLGRAVDLDPVIAILEEAHAATPSLKTRESLISAISHRAAIDLGRSQPTFQAFAGKHLRAAGAGRLLALALAKDPELRRAALAREDFQRALALLREGGKACPGRRDPWEWALFSAVDPEEALRAQADIRGAELASLYRRIAFQLAPFNVSLALDLYWERLLAGGDAAEGKRLLERCAATGAPVPPVK
jgi:tetratricopeptide (TPR) repeat protein